MSRNRIVLALFIVLHLGISKAQELMPISEDELIIRGLLYEEYKSYEDSYQTYKTLFDTTGAKVYLFKEVTSALMLRKHITESINRLKIWDKTHPDEIEVRRLLIPLYLTSKQIQNATKEAEFLLEQSRKVKDLDLASNSFLYAGNFKRALSLLSEVYETIAEEKVLLRMADIMSEFAGERKQAIQLLETHRRMNTASQEVYFKLLILYQKEKDIDGLLSTYEALYEIDNNEQYLAKIIDAYMYKRDVDGAIDFLEKYHKKDILLYELYKIRKDFTKAFALADILYSENKNAKWIAEKGMLIFEEAKNKNDKKMIAEVISYFEKAVKLGVDDSIYLNYYGYTLIDKEIDVKKGIQVIEDALVQQPNNTYYLDSLAWGYYKENDCAKAYSLMKKVVEEEGLEQKEIIEHWHAIRQCK